MGGGHGGNGRAVAAAATAAAARRRGGRRGWTRVPGTDAPRGVVGGWDADGEAGARSEMALEIIG